MPISPNPIVRWLSFWVESFDGPNRKNNRELAG
jgi:hypothetical protein